MQTHGATVTPIRPEDIDFDRYMRETEPQAKLRPLADWVPALIARRTGGIKVVGDGLPWGKTHDKIRLRRGNVSIWAGVNGHGKSLMTGQVMLGLMAQGRRCVVASMEMDPVDTADRMIRQCAHTEHYTEQFIHKWEKWSRPLLWAFNERGQTTADRVLAMCRYAADQLEVDHVFIDSLMKVVRHEDDYNGQKAFIDSACSIAQATGMHIHIVHHMRKGQDEYSPSGKFGLKGTGAISDQVDNIFEVWRNKRKAQDREEGKEVDEGKPDALLVCHKQRHGHHEPKVALWFHEPSTQFVAAPKAGALDMMS